MFQINPSVEKQSLGNKATTEIKRKRCTRTIMWQMKRTALEPRKWIIAACETPVQWEEKTIEWKTSTNYH